MKLYPPLVPLLAAMIFAAGCGRPSPSATSGGSATTAEWTRMFDGATLAGWKSNEETPGTFVIEDGAIKTANGRAHLFYTGPNGNASFKNFEFKAKVKHMPGSNSGIYFHTRYQDKGWPEIGFEAQVNSTSHKDPKKTGGLYAIADVMDTAPAPDGEWFDYFIRVDGRHVVIKINDKVTTDWTQPADWDPAKALQNNPGRKLGEGTIAIQGHDPKSIVYYKDLQIRALP